MASPLQHTPIPREYRRFVYLSVLILGGIHLGRLGVIRSSYIFSSTLCPCSLAIRPVRAFIPCGDDHGLNTCTVLSARDAWIQADVNRFDGANKCILWDAFASRGLGVNAENHNDDGTVPDGC